MTSASQVALLEKASAYHGMQYRTVGDTMWLMIPVIGKHGDCYTEAQPVRTLKEFRKAMGY